MMLQSLIFVVAMLVASNAVAADIASHYGAGDGYYGRAVACPGYGKHKPGLDTAHKSLPCGTKVRITNVKNGKSVDVVVNNRGPFISGRTWDLNSHAASLIGITGIGTVRAEILK